MKLSILDPIKEQLAVAAEKVFSEYGVVVVVLFTGFLIGWFGKRFLSDGRYLKQLNLRLDERDQRIELLNALILERMDKINPEKKDKRFFNKLKQIFRNPKKFRR